MKRLQAQAPVSPPGAAWNKPKHIARGAPGSTGISREYFCVLFPLHTDREDRVVLGAPRLPDWREMKTGRDDDAERNRSREYIVIPGPWDTKKAPLARGFLRRDHPLLGRARNLRRNVDLRSLVRSGDAPEDEEQHSDNQQSANDYSKHGIAATITVSHFPLHMLPAHLQFKNLNLVRRIFFIRSWGYGRAGKHSPVAGEPWSVLRPQ